MAECECLSVCPFFNDKMKDQEGVSGIYKSGYCHDQYQNCARYIVFKELGRDEVPGDLYPNMRSRAIEVIDNSKSGSPSVSEQE